MVATFVAKVATCFGYPCQFCIRARQNIFSLPKHRGDQFHQALTTHLSGKGISESFFF